MEGHQEARQTSPDALADAITPVIDRMKAIQAPLDEADGVRRFNELYLAVTVAVSERIPDQTYEDPSFVTRLDVVFAELYFDAVDDDARGRDLPKAWAPLFEERHKMGIAPLQFAIAGMNAHINHDLAIALVATCKQVGIGLDTDTPQHRDYLVVNGILATVQDAIKERFETGVIADIDKAFGTADDMFASWSVEKARDAAWRAGQVLETLEGIGLARDAFLFDLAQRTGFASRLLLSRTG